MMSLLQELVESGRIADIILLGLAIETIALALFVKDRNAPLHVSQFWPTLVAGGCFAIALRLTLTKAPWTAIALALAGALLAHVLDFRKRLRKSLDEV